MFILIHCKMVFGLEPKICRKFLFLVLPQEWELCVGKSVELETWTSFFLPLPAVLVWKEALALCQHACLYTAKFLK